MRISFWLWPAAKRSRISLTLIRIPRIQGRPPHWLGLTVIRSSRSAMGCLRKRAYQNPVLQGRHQISATSLQAAPGSPDTLEARDLSVIRLLVLDDLVVGSVHRGGQIVQQHRFHLAGYSTTRPRSTFGQAQRLTAAGRPRARSAGDPSTSRWEALRFSSYP